jgi:hypothetical protein
MLRWVFFLRYPEGVSKDDGERWYLGTHTQEAKRLQGLRRYVSWRTERARIAPVWSTVEALNRWDRVTELWFDDWAAWEAAAITHVPAYTAPPYGWPGFISETIFIGETSDRDFLGASPPVGSLQGDEADRLVRWLFILRYPETITKEQGESWYLGTHTQEAKHMLGLRRYISFTADPRPDTVSPQMPSRWDRLTELAFHDWAAWEEGAVTKMPAWTPPPYGNPGFLSETAFITEHPQYDFLREVPKVP